jgi:hypothetical protein
MSHLLAINNRLARPGWIDDTNHRQENIKLLFQSVNDDLKGNETEDRVGVIWDRKPSST